MKLIVGLGNPERGHARTRHNVGFQVVERFAERHRIDIGSEKFDGRFGRGRAAGTDVGLLMPLTYMNLSGASVAAALGYLPVGDVGEDLVLVFDDVDLPFGRLRVRAAGGSGGHRGIADVIERLGRKDFARVRFGVGRPHGRMDTASYVLQRFSPEEQKLLPRMLDEAAAALELLIRGELQEAMNRFNPQRSAPEEDVPPPRGPIDRD